MVHQAAPVHERADTGLPTPGVRCTTHGRLTLPVGHRGPTLFEGTLQMPLPTFAAPMAPSTQPVTLSRTTAAARLELHVAHVDKMVRAQMLPLPITAESVNELLGRPWLEVVDGELTVLRTDARAEADPEKHPGDPRRWIGFHVDHTDPELEETSLRWWRSDSDRVVNNELFAVTVATFPVAVYRILKLQASETRPDEPTARHHYAGQLLARVTRGMVVGYRDPMPGHLRSLVTQIMASRIVVSSGGPIGYLEPAGGRAATVGRKGGSPQVPQQTVGELRDVDVPLR